MEELHKIAEACYNTASEDVKKLAHEFFKAMDHDGDGRVSLHEFLAFMSEQGYIQMKNSSFFIKLNKDGSGSLNFWEVATLYYIIQSGRPFCEGCSIFINGMFFTCVKCFDCDSTTFNLCFDCFQSGKYRHEHKQFLDNFVLLEAKRKAVLKDKASLSDSKQDKSSFSDTKQDKASSSDPTTQAFINFIEAKAAGSSKTSRALITAPTASTSRSIVPFNNQPKNGKSRAYAQRLLLALETAISIANVASNFCTIL